jgi:hypothetical protein
MIAKVSRTGRNAQKVNRSFKRIEKKKKHIYLPEEGGDGEKAEGF